MLSCHFTNFLHAMFILLLYSHSFFHQKFHYSNRFSLFFPFSPVSVRLKIKTKPEWMCQFECRNSKSTAANFTPTSIQINNIL